MPFWTKVCFKPFWAINNLGAQPDLFTVPGLHYTSTEVSLSLFAAIMFLNKQINVYKTIYQSPANYHIYHYHLRHFKSVIDRPYPTQNYLSHRINANVTGNKIEVGYVFAYRLSRLSSNTNKLGPSACLLVEI